MCGPKREFGTEVDAFLCALAPLRECFILSKGRQFPLTARPVQHAARCGRCQKRIMDSLGWMLGVSPSILTGS